MIDYGFTSSKTYPIETAIAWKAFSEAELAASWGGFGWVLQQFIFNIKMDLLKEAIKQDMFPLAGRTRVEIIVRGSIDAVSTEVTEQLGDVWTADRQREITVARWSA